MELFRKNRAHELSKTIQKLFDTEGFYEELLKYDSQMDSFYNNLGMIIEYYIITRDKKMHTVDELMNLISNLYNEWKEKYKENAMNKGFLTHSCNGLFKEKILENGLGHQNNRDKDLESKLTYLEEYLGQSRYLKQQKNTYDEIYLSTPGTSSISYASNYAPERLFLGILSQDNPLPIIVGETRLDYYKRVIDEKVKDLDNSEDLKKIAYEVLEKLLTKRPIIVFVPINSRNYKLNISMSSTSSEKVEINKFIEDNIHDDYLRFFSHTINGWDSNNLNDMVVENVLIPPKELGIITIPSRYEFIQMKAKVLGISNGKTINYDGEEITEEVTEEKYEYKWNETNEEHVYNYRVTNNKKI